jgi:hypothetical protein
MSYFKSRTSETSNTTTNTNTNNFRNTFISSTKPITEFNLSNEAFPDLLVSNNKKPQVANANATSSKNVLNYTNMALKLDAKNESNVVKKAEEVVPPGWVQYTVNKNTGKITVSHSKKTNYELVKEKRLLIESDPYFAWMMTLKELSINWNKYKVIYDKIHGQGAYEEMYYSEPIYPGLDATFYSDEDSENEHFNDYNYHYDSSQSN